VPGNQDIAEFPRAPTRSTKYPFSCNPLILASVSAIGGYGFHIVDKTCKSVDLSGLTVPRIALEK
jgi:hypothetical protein